MNLLVTGALPLTSEKQELLQKMGHAVTYHARERDPLPIPYDTVEGVICNGLFLHHSLEHFSSLRYIQLTSAGIDRVPWEAIRRAGIVLHRAAGVYDIPMAEHALCAVLAIYRRWDGFRVNQRAHRWEKCRDLGEFCGRRVCIVGCGGVGNACAERFAACGCTVYGVDRVSRADTRYTRIWPQEHLNEALAGADVVILSLPLTNETHHLIGYRELALLRDGCVLVNLARGGIVCTEALVEVFSRRSLYAVLDVQETEPLSPDSPLWDMGNVFLTPHNSFVGEGNDRRLWEVVVRNLGAYECDGGLAL